MSGSLWRTFPRTTLVLAFVVISTLMQLQTIVDLHPTTTDAAPAHTGTPHTGTAHTGTAVAVNVATDSWSATR